MNSQDYIIKEGQVEFVENGDILNENIKDEGYVYRIKVRLSQDDNTPIDKLPWAFPLIPKVFHTVPKKGEGVFVFLSKSGDKNSNRFYLGPIISQPQYQENCPYEYGRGPAVAFMQGGNEGHQLKSITQNANTTGAFPKPNDVAVVGRASEDIILKEGEIDIRCGIRSEAFTNNDLEELKGKIIFNTNSPSYIQLKYKQGLTNRNGQEANSLVNIVADKINLITHQQITNMGIDVTDKNELIEEDKLDEMMSKLHQLPYGDILVEYLTIMRNAITTHGHNFSPGSPPIDNFSILRTKQLDMNKILSENVRIS